MLTSFRGFLAALSLFCYLGPLFGQQFPIATGRRGMVVAAESLATRAGVEILKQGGNAVDAAVAVGFALAVTYPVAGNIGGGGFMVIHTADGKDITIDYREKAPLRASRDMYLKADGKVDDDKARNGETSAGVPGSVAGLLFALEKYGTMSRSQVISPAYKLAKEGFQLPYSTARSFNNYRRAFQRYPSTRKIFTQSGRDFLPGEVFTQKDLARTLQRIIREGNDGFYRGETAAKIIKQCSGFREGISAEDLRQYKPVMREAIKIRYGGYQVVSMPPPSSGGVILGEMLNFLTELKIIGKFGSTADYYHPLIETMKFAYADRAKYLGDPDFTRVPVDSLLSSAYARQIARYIDPDKSIPSGKIGDSGSKLINEHKETTHYSIIDSNGMAVSITTTINSGYGSKVIVEGAGFFLNNEMDDFSAKPGHPNQFGLVGSEANSISAGKRMLSSMTPSIVLKDSKPFLILGSPGGSTIITVVLQVLLNVVEKGMSIRRAVDEPRIHHQWLPETVEYEAGAVSEQERTALMNKGHKLKKTDYLGLVEAIMVGSDGKYYGATDSRGSGLALGF